MGPVVGTASNDTLVGSAANETLKGLGGDDVLDGGRGDDLLQGGTGLDTYRLALDGGRDRIEEVAGEGGEIRLGADLDFDDLVLLRSGQDLRVSIGGSDRGSTIAGYFDAPSSWSVRTEAGAERDVAQWWQAQASQPEDVVVAARQAAIAMAKLYWGGSSTFRYPDTVVWYDTLTVVTISNYTRDQRTGGVIFLPGSTRYDGGSGPDWPAGIRYEDVTAFGTAQVATDAAFTRVQDFSSATSLTRLSGSLAPGNAFTSYQGQIRSDFGLWDPALVLVDGTVLYGYLMTQDLVIRSTPYYIRGVGGPTPNGPFLRQTETRLFKEVIGGPGDNTIVGASLVDGGAGNDVVWVRENFLPREEYAAQPNGLPPRRTWLSGGDGNDRLFGAEGEDFLMGGRGSDVLRGGAGADTYYLASDDDGWDLVLDQGALDWGEGQGARRQFENWFRANYPGQPVPLNLSADHPLVVASGVVRTDTVRFGSGIDAQNLAVRLTTIASPELPAGDQLAIEVSWAGQSGVRIPFSQSFNGQLGQGIERFVFADGSVLNMSEMIQRATWPAGWVRLDPAAGAQTVSLGAGVDTLVVPSLNAGEIRVSRDALDLLVRDVASGQVARVVNWYSSGSLEPVTRLVVEHGSDGRPAFGSVANLTYAGLVVEGGAGNDTLIGLEGYSDTLSGAGGNDILTGLGQADSLDGGEGDDTLSGGIGDDALSGGAGNDTYIFNRGDGVDSIFDTEGADVLVFGGGIQAQELSLGLGSLLIRVGNGTGDQVHIGNFDPQNPLAATGGVSSFRFGDGTVLSLAQLLERGFDIQGNDFGSYLTGTALVDRIRGGTGSDYLDGGRGDDTLEGGAGGDAYAFGRDYGQDSILDVGLPNDAADTLYFNADVAPADVLVSRQGMNLVVALQGTTDALTIKQWFQSGDYRIEQIWFADGTLWDAAFLESLVPSTNQAPQLQQPLGDQSAHEGNVFTFQVPANAFADPDAGDALTYTAALANGDSLPSWLSFDAATKTVSGTPGPNLSPVTIRVTATDTAGESASDDFVLSVVDNVRILAGTSGADTLTGAGNDDTLSGLGGNDALAGLGGNDRLDGGSGADTMTGGPGNDTYVVDNAGDSVLEVAGGGNDVVESSLGAYMLPGEVEGLLLLGTVNRSGTGNALANTLTGNSAANTLDGGAGDDILAGRAGNDTLVGGDGDDTFLIQGDEGTDSYIGGLGSDRILGSIGDDIMRVTSFDVAAAVELIDGNGGVDRITGTSVNDVIDLSGTALVGIASIDGGAGNDTIAGSVGDDTIVGGLGADTLAGGDGNDVFVVSGTDTAADAFAGGGGFDVIQGVTGVDTFRMTRFAVSDSVERIDGGGGTDTIAGTSVNDVLDFSGTQLAGIVAIDGGAGNDTITGSAGDDTIVGGAGADTLAGGDGNDTFLISGSDTGADSFAGGAGADRILGSSGDDVIRVTRFDAANSVEAIVGNGGVDRVAGTSVNDVVDLSATTLFGIASVEGGAGNDQITGSTGNDVIAGNAGSDTLAGGIGSDTYLLGRTDGADIIRENDTTAGNTDVARFLTGVANDQLWFRRVGNDLEASIIGTTDRFTIQSWYVDTANRVEQIRTVDGNRLLIEANVQNLVNAMAAFAPPALGETTLSASYQTALNPVLAANWQ